MAPFGRLAPGQIVAVTSLAAPHSFFDLRESQFPDCENLGRLFSQIRVLGAKTLVIEEVDSARAEDLRQENEDLAIRIPGFGTGSSRTFRLSFFTRRFHSARGLSRVKRQEFVGYILVKEETWPSGSKSRRVFESVLPTGDIIHNYVRGAQRWPCRVGSRKFSVRGYVYAQQNGITNVCAHVALRTVAARFHPAGDMTYQAMNAILGIDHRKNWVGRSLALGVDGRGLSISEMETILGSLGLSVTRADYTGEAGFVPAAPYQRYVYGSIESGFPSIIVFDTSTSGAMHAIPVFGHTFNRDTWVPSAERGYFQVGPSTQYLPSESWVSSFVMHDDNYGSNFCVPRHYLRPVAPEGSKPAVPDAPESESEEDDSETKAKMKAAGSEWVAHVICPRPEKVRLTPLFAEVVGVDFLWAILPQLPSDGNQWGNRLIDFMGASRCVFRPLLVDGKDYIKHLAKMRGWSGGKIDRTIVNVLKRLLDRKQVWIVEMSVPELFSANLRKIGEVVLFSDHEVTSDRDFASFVLARLPGYFVLCQSGGKSPKFSFVPSGISSHVPLLGAD
ncbi:hypothetical protein BH23VER1_BH23VER1_13480 [soil metagenome]